MNTESLIVGLTILSTSFLGSWHCAAMCGPVTSLMDKKNSFWPYQLGRGFSYTAVGAVGGYLGSFFLDHQLYYIRLISGIFFAVILIGIGIFTIRNMKLISAPQIGWIHSLYTRESPGLILGLLTVFLPCGWLYSYILASVATKSAFSGSAMMFLFWLGGLPALSTVTLIVKKTVQSVPSNKHRWVGLLLVGAGLYSLVNSFITKSCH